MEIWHKLIALSLMPLSVSLSFFSLPVRAADFSLSSSSGIWTGTVGGSDVNGIGTNEVRWGIPLGSESKGQSGLRFDGVGFNDFNIDEAFKVGTLTHFNNIIIGSFANSADLEISLDLVTPNSIQIFDFTFKIDETPNGGDCPYPSTQPCSDRITFPDSLSAESFTFLERNFTLELVGFGDSPDNLEEGYISQEGGSNSISIFAEIIEDTRIPVPESEPKNTATTLEPMTIGSLGLFGIYIASLRLRIDRKNKNN